MDWEGEGGIAMTGSTPKLQPFICSAVQRAVVHVVIHVEAVTHGKEGPRTRFCHSVNHTA